MTKLSVGDKIPAFELLDQNENAVKDSDFKGKKILIYFYPRANTPGCTTQSCSVRDAKKSLASQNVVVIGISPDTPKKQSNFDAKYELSFPLLCDTEHEIAEDFGVWAEKSMYGKKFMGIVRSSFLVDEEGVIMNAWYKIKPNETVVEAEKELNK